MRASAAASATRTGEFSARAHRLFQHFVPQPKINIALPAGISGTEVTYEGRVIGVDMTPDMVGRARKTSSSRKVTQPGFSIAPALNSGTKAWW